ncbi:MAG: hypothetical protein ABSA54_03805 [Terriglobales bacterium]|jgi:hypothetical protein
MERPEGSFDPYEGEISIRQPSPHGPQEQYGGRVEEQHEIARRSLNYPGRFAPAVPERDSDGGGL